MSYYHCPNNGCGYVLLCVSKIDSISGTGVPGAVFELTTCNGCTRTGTTDVNGLMLFGVTPCASYTLREVSAPPGYETATHVYKICVAPRGSIFVDGIPTSQVIIHNTPIAASFTAIKINIENGMPLAGAVYSLLMNSSEVASTVSGAMGQVTFTNLSPGTYELVETAPPPGFQANTEGLPVVAHQDGSVTVNGRPANGFILNDVQLSAFIFRKLNASTGLPLAGATFTLAQDGSVMGTATSGSDGLVNFGILGAGTYQLTETIVPPGFQPNGAVYEVIVGTDGSITVNGAPLNEFMVQDIPIEVSAPPTIHTIVEGASLITGSGVPGAIVVVTLPDGSTVAAVVDASETWTADVPSGVNLVAGDMVSANQTETGKTVSGDAYAIVIGDTTVEPGIDVYVENLTTGQNYAQAGNVLLYDFIISNHGTASSVWRSAYATFFLGNSVTLQESSIRINNRTVTSSQYSFDSVENALTVYLGDIVGGNSVSVSYRVTVNLDISDINEIIMEAILGSLA